MNNDFTIELGAAAALTMHAAHGEGGWRVTLVDTGLETMTGARIKRASPLPDRRPVHADLRRRRGGRGHPRRSSPSIERAGTVGAVTGVRPSSRFGELLAIGGDRVRQFSEKPQTHAGLINGGFFVFDARILDYLERRRRLRARAGAARAARRRRPAGGVPSTTASGSAWTRIATYQLLNQLWDSGEAAWKTLVRPVRRDRRPSRRSGATGPSSSRAAPASSAVGSSSGCSDSAPTSSVSSAIGCRSQELWPPGLLEHVTVVRGDLGTRPFSSARSASTRSTTVIHLAAQTIVGIANRNPVSTFEANIHGTWTLLEACRRSPAGRARSSSLRPTRPTATATTLPYDEDTAASRDAIRTTSASRAAI